MTAISVPGIEFGRHIVEDNPEDCERRCSHWARLMVIGASMHSLRPELGEVVVALPVSSTLGAKVGRDSSSPGLA